MHYNNLPEFGELYAEYYDPVQKSFEVRRKSRTEGNLFSVGQCVEYIDAFLKKYQLTFVPNKIDRSILFFPFMMMKPSEGDKIINLTTKEVYTVDQIINNPETGMWDGLIKFDLAVPPSMESLHALDYVTSNRLVRFEHEIPDGLPNLIGANLERLAEQPPSLLPTITWTVISVEPGTLGSINSSRKEWKPRLRESVKDPLVPGHTVEIWGQRFENTVQFDCWSNDPRTSDRLVRWFEQFMRLYTGHLRRAGAGQILFTKRNRDDLNQTWRQSYNVRGSQYIIETEQLTSSYLRDILNIDISIEATDQDIRNRKFNETRWVADQIVSGKLTSEEYRDLFYRSGEYLFGNIDIKQ